MHLVRLVYASKVTEELTQDDIQQILDSARSNNEKEQVTGLLCFNRKYFLQCLEGSRSSVNKIYHAISNDNRHDKLELLDYREINVREFADWSMGYMPEMALTEDLNLKYSESTDFNPYKMSGESCHKMLIELSVTVPVI